jgi:hypothetical protein
MSTKMTDTDWANALEVFRACLPRRGRKATDDRLFRIHPAKAAGLMISARLP